MKRLYFIIFLIIATYSSNGQAFTQAVGLRATYFTPGFEYRKYTDDINSYKLLLGVRDGGVQLHALKEFHTYDLFDFAYQLVFYYGFGIHGGFQTWDEAFYDFNTVRTETKSTVVAGVDVLLGLEYVFDMAPVSAGVEVKPYFDVLARNNFTFIPYDFAFTIKYLF